MEGNDNGIFTADVKQEQSSSKLFFDTIMFRFSQSYRNQVITYNLLVIN